MKAKLKSLVDAFLRTFETDGERAIVDICKADPGFRARLNRAADMLCKGQDPRDQRVRGYTFVTIGAPTVRSAVAFTLPPTGIDMLLSRARARTDGLGRPLPLTDGLRQVVDQVLKDPAPAQPAPAP